MEFTLLRTYYPNGTNGSLLLDPITIPIVHTIERPWKKNEPRSSCLPEGTYEVTWRYGNGLKPRMIITGEAGRSTIILQHAKKAITKPKGFIAPVKQLTGEGKGRGSGRAFDKLNRIINRTLETRPVFLTIKSK